MSKPAKVEFTLPSDLAAAVQAGQAALSSRDAEHAAAEHAVSALQGARQALIAATEREEGAELALARGGADTQALARAADGARAEREDAAIEVERATRRVKVLADAGARNDERVAEAVLKLDAATEARAGSVRADYLARLAAAVQSLLPLIAEGYSISDNFPRKAHLSAVLREIVLPKPDISLEDFCAVGRVPVLVAAGRRPSVDAPAAAIHMADAMAPVVETATALQEILRAERRRELEEERRLEGHREPPGVTITYATDAPMVSQGPLWAQRP